MTSTSLQQVRLPSIVFAITLMAAVMESFPAAQVETVSSKMLRRETGETVPRHHSHHDGHHAKHAVAKRKSRRYEGSAQVQLPAEDQDKDVLNKKSRRSIFGKVTGIHSHHGDHHVKKVTGKSKRRRHDGSAQVKMAGKDRIIKENAHANVASLRQRDPPLEDPDVAEDAQYADFDDSRDAEDAQYDDARYADSDDARYVDSDDRYVDSDDARDADEDNQYADSDDARDADEDNQYADSYDPRDAQNENANEKGEDDVLNAADKFDQKVNDKFEESMQKSAERRDDAFAGLTTKTKEGIEQTEMKQHLKSKVNKARADEDRKAKLAERAAEIYRDSEERSEQVAEATDQLTEQGEDLERSMDTLKFEVDQNKKLDNELNKKRIEAERVDAERREQELQDRQKDQITRAKQIEKQSIANMEHRKEVQAQERKKQQDYKDSLEEIVH